MSVFAGKAIGLLLKPLGLGLSLMLAGLVLRRWARRWGSVLLGTGVVVLWMASLPAVGTAWIRTLEAPYPPHAPGDVPPAEAIVVLGGGVTPVVGDRFFADLTDAADRVWHAARLYHAGTAPRIIASGGGMPWRDPSAREAPAMQALLHSWGVPDSVVWRESESATTRENAVRTAALCRARGIERVVLVTSAWHMQRAAAAFRGAGLAVVPAATDYRGGPEPLTALSLLPTAEGLHLSTTAAHESLGLLFYRLRGWTD